MLKILMSFINSKFTKKIQVKFNILFYCSFFIQDVQSNNSNIISEVGFRN